MLSAKVLVFIALVGMAICSDAEVSLEFGKFIKKFGKKYDSIEETIKRFNIFKEHYAYITKHNSENNDFKLGINHLSDLTLKEIKQKYRTGKSLPINYCTLKHVPTEGHPVIDWREQKVITPVRDQGRCGSCWAFSAVGALESAHAIKKGGSLVALSLQEILDCSRDYDNEGCEGGNMGPAFVYVKDHGISTEKEYPYEAADRKCRKKSSGYKVSGCVNVTADDSNELLEALSYGPVSISVRSDNYVFTDYTSGIITGKCGNESDELDHAILLVGAGVDKTSGIPYWILKNSWSAYWGEGGYLRIKRDTAKGHGICGMAMENFYPVV